jgi:hypothetical protein
MLRPQPTHTTDRPAAREAATRSCRGRGDDTHIGSGGPGAGGDEPAPTRRG